MRALVAGANGFVGRRLVPALAADGFEVRSIVRDAAAADPALAAAEVLGIDVNEGGPEMAAALDGVHLAYFLIHMMGRDDDYADRELASAERFATAAREAGVAQVVYLGGLGSDPISPHLRSRHATAEALSINGPPLTYFRASMVIGAGSESYVLLRSIVEKLLVVPDRKWFEVETQPIGVRDLLRYLRAAPFVPECRGREIDIGGPNRVRHRDLVDELARQLGRRPPRRVPAPGVTPELVASAAKAVTRGNKEVAQELVKSLPIPTAVEDDSGMALFENITPEPISVAFQRAIEEDEIAEEERRSLG